MELVIFAPNECLLNQHKIYQKIIPTNSRYSDQISYQLFCLVDLLEMFMSSLLRRISC